MKDKNYWLNEWLIMQCDRILNEDNEDNEDSDLVDCIVNGDRYGFMCKNDKGKRCPYY